VLYQFYFSSWPRSFNENLKVIKFPEKINYSEDPDKAFGPQVSAARY
jgi:hypothetical protein